MLRRANSTHVIGAVAAREREQRGANAAHVVVLGAQARLRSRSAIGLTKPYESKMPRNVPTSAAATFSPISAAVPPIEPIVITTPSTAATMPKPGNASPILASAAGIACASSRLPLEIEIENLGEVMIFDGAGQQHLQRVAEERQRVMVVARRTGTS